MKHKKEYTKSLAITVLFDTAIAAVLFLMVMKDESFWTIFIISQFTGLSICSFVNLGIRISEDRLNGWMGVCIAFGLFAGVIVGGVLSLGFLYFSQGLELYSDYGRVFSQVAVFGLVFGVPIIYFFTTRERLAEFENKIQEEKIKRLTMEKEAAMTTLRLLQAQIEPHFLFNTLSNVIMLFDIDVKKAKKMLIDVNEYLRISLDRTRQEMITLSQELDLVKQYLDIFQIRMGDRLSFKIEDRTGLDEFLFPPLIIQPLVENANKYGLEPKVEGGRISIDCRMEGTCVEIEISDTGNGIDTSAKKAGIGINNVSQRLAAIYGDEAGLTLRPNRPSGLKAVIKVPI